MQDFYFLFISGSIYATALIYFYKYIKNKQMEFSAWADYLTRIGFFFQTLFFISRFWIENKIVISNVSDAFLLYSWAILLLYIVLRKKYNIFKFFPGIFVFFFIIFIISVVFYKPAAQSIIVNEKLNSSWFWIHSLSAVLAYACFSFSFISCLFYFIMRKAIKNKNITISRLSLPSLEDLDKINFLNVFLGLIFLTFSIITGGIYAHNVWKNEIMWYLDPKVIAVYIIWLIYALIVLLRYFNKFTTKKIIILSMFGFIFSIASFLLLNFISKIHNFTT